MQKYFEHDSVNLELLILSFEHETWTYLER